ncbi:hypothetical protein HC341_06990 [Aquisalimonas sp. 2447]|uniref:hypothetical protein n=1 Tax=Aquisalimonas sp. 2447 TaxID=2740807 RepID=UPI00143249EC|nr:hypothetical protein [Aquisalimonas sp. 2447]QIT54980.1 hypothetical protein HC341_06990 [Aquisalimonas sp. 2447]
MDQDLEERRRSLEQRRDELSERLQRIKMDYGRGLERDLEEQALQLENAEVLHEISRVTAEELATIEAAIRRIEEAMGRQKPVRRS